MYTVIESSGLRGLQMGISPGVEGWGVVAMDTGPCRREGLVRLQDSSVSAQRPDGADEFHLLLAIDTGTEQGLLFAPPMPAERAKILGPTVGAAV